jgi:radical SAM superfamily enzyme YgiQ (UPF0313 family)
MRILFVINELGLMDPAGIAYLSGVARDLGHERFLCILQKHDITRRISKVKPDVIAYSLNSCEADKVFKIHKDKVKPTRIFSIMGGPHPTFYPDTIEESGADAYCIGEGEMAFSELLQALEKGLCIDDIKNICTIKKCNPSHNLADLDTLPMPDRDLVLGSTFLAGFPRKTFFTSRGCPFNCTYCFNPTFRKMYKGKGTWCRRFSVDRIIREIKDVRAKYRLEFVKFDDDVFAMKADPWLEEFTDKYLKEIGLPLNCLIHLEHASEDMLKLLVKAGCYSITTSVDSTCDRIRREVLKRATLKSNDELIESLLRIRRHGINVFVNYITAVPTSTEKDEIDTILMSKAGRVVYANYTTLVPFHGTEIWQYCKDLKLYDRKTIPKSLLKPSLLKGVSHQQRRIQRNVLLLGAYGCVMPNWLIKPLLKIISYVPPNPIFIILYSLLKSWQMSTKIYPLKASSFYQIKIGLRALINDIKEVS